MHTPFVSRWIGLLLWLALGLQPALAAPEPPASATPAATTPYTSRAGDTLEKIAAKHYAGSPLQHVVLAKLLLEHNAAALGPGAAPKKRLKPGTALALPEHTQLLRQALAPYLGAEPATPAANHGYEARRHWVHYP